MRRARSRSGLLLVVFVAATVPAAGQDRREPEVEVAEATPTAAVEIDGQVLFRLRGLGVYTAEQRAAAVAGRIRQVADDATFPPDELRITEQDGVLGIQARELRVLGVFDGDAKLEALSREELAAALRTHLTQAIAEYRRARSPDALARATWRTAVATLVLAAVVVLLWFVWRRVARVLESHVRSRVESVGISSFEIARAGRVWELFDRAVRLLRALVFLAAFFFYFQYVLTLYPWTRWLANDMGGWVIGPIVSMGRGLLAQIPNLIFLAVLFVVVRWVLRLIRLFFEGVEQGTVQLRNFDSDWAVPTYRLMRILVVVFALVVAYPYIPGSGSLAFQGLSVFLGILFSLGSSSAIANIVAGYSLTYRKAFKLGDRIRIGDTMGDVTAVRLQVTHLRTPKNEEVVIPNSSILGQDVVNYSTLARSHGLLLHTTVGIGYETPWRQVEALLIEAARRTPGMREDPAPFVLQKALGDFCVTYELNAAIDEPRAMMQRYTDLHRNVLDVFNEYGVQIMTPAYEGDPEEPKLVPKERWFEAPAREAGQGKPDGRMGNRRA